MSGPGVERSGLKANEPTHFTVDCTEAGEGELWPYPPTDLPSFQRACLDHWRAGNLPNELGRLLGDI